MQDAAQRVRHHAGHEFLWAREDGQAGRQVCSGSESYLTAGMPKHPITCRFDEVMLIKHWSLDVSSLFRAVLGITLSASSRMLYYMGSSMEAVPQQQQPQASSAGGRNADSDAAARPADPLQCSAEEGKVDDASSTEPLEQSAAPATLLKRSEPHAFGSFKTFLPLCQRLRSLQILWKVVQGSMCN